MWLLAAIAFGALVVLFLFLYLVGKSEEPKPFPSAWNVIKTLLVSMIPVIELRGAIPIAVASGMNYWQAFLISYIGNCIVIVPVILLTRTVLTWLKMHIGFLRRLVERFELYLMKKGERALRYEEIGLLLFVAIPIPGTGAWTGAMIAGLLGLRASRSAIIIAVGVLIAGIIISLLTKAVTVIV